MSRFPIIPAQPSPLMMGINKGFDFYHNLLQAMGLPEAMKSDQELKKTQILSASLNNEDQAIRNKYLEDMIKTSLGLQQSQAEHMNGLSSPMGQLFQDYQRVLRDYGENSPQSHQFQKMMNNQIESQDIRNDYYKGLTKSQSTRNLPVFAKEQLINQLLGNGYDINQVSKLLAGESPNQISTNPELAKNQQEESESYIMGQYLPASAKKSAYAAVTARPFGEAIMKDLPEASQYFGPKAVIKLKSDQLKSLEFGETPKGLESLGRFNQNLELYKEKVADILGIPASDMARTHYGKAFDFKTWYTNPEYAHNLLNDLVQRVNEAEKGNLIGLSQVRQHLSNPIGNIPLTINSSQLSQGMNNHPELSKSVGIQKKIYTGSDGKTYTREELEKIARGG